MTPVEGGVVSKRVVRGRISGCLLYADRKGLTIELLEHALHGAGAAAAGHGDVELVVVLGHFGGWWVAGL